MKLMKRLCAMLLTVGMMAFTLTACGSQKDKKSEETTTVADATSTEETRTAGEASSDVATITEDEAINLVKEVFGEEYSYVTSGEIEEKNGNQYYVIYVKQLLDEGTFTTIATYLVKTDGSALFDKDAVSYAGEYVKTGDVGEVTFVVYEDMTFEMTVTGEVNQVVSGAFKPGITNSERVIKLLLYPKKNVVDGEEKEVEVQEGTAVIEGDKLTLTMESEETIFTKK